MFDNNQDSPFDFNNKQDSSFSSPFDFNNDQKEKSQNPFDFNKNTKTQSNPFDFNKGNDNYGGLNISESLRRSGSIFDSRNDSKESNNFSDSCFGELNQREANYSNMSVVDKMRGLTGGRLDNSADIDLYEQYNDSALDKRTFGGAYNVTLTDIYGSKTLLNQHFNLYTDSMIEEEENNQLEGDFNKGITKNGDNNQPATLFDKYRGNGDSTEPETLMGKYSKKKPDKELNMESIIESTVEIKKNNEEDLLDKYKKKKNEDCNEEVEGEEDSDKLVSVYAKKEKIYKYMEDAYESEDCDDICDTCEDKSCEKDSKQIDICCKKPIIKKIREKVFLSHTFSDAPIGVDRNKTKIQNILNLKDIEFKYGEGVLNRAEVSYILNNGSDNSIINLSIEELRERKRILEKELLKNIGDIRKYKILRKIELYKKILIKKILG